MQNITGILYPNRIQDTAGVSPSGQRAKQSEVTAAQASDTAQIGAHRPALHEQVFSPGRALRVTRTSGAVESDWHIAALTGDGKLVVEKSGLQKTYDPSQLRQILAANPELIPYGASLRVLRSSGAHEEGWQVSGMQNGLLCMTRSGLRKDLTMQSILSENPELLPPQARSGNAGQAAVQNGAMYQQAFQQPAVQQSSVQQRPAVQQADLQASGRNGQAEPAASFAISNLSRAEGQAILSRAQFMPNPSGIYPNEASPLTTSFLASRGLEPVSTISAGDKKIHISAPYQSDAGGRPAFVAYVEDRAGNVKTRTFYLSKSQGLWRSASHFGPNGWIGKGSASEESTNIPIPMQKMLYSRLEQGSMQLSKADGDTAFYGGLTLGGHEPPKEFSEGLKVDSLGSFDRKTADGYGEPSSFTLTNPGQGPEFRKLEDHYTINHPMHGKIDAYVYPSHDGSSRYMFYRDKSGRSWIASIEDAQAPLTGYGVRSHVLDPGDLTMPALEYGQQVPIQYRGQCVCSPYFDASAYTHNLPIVKAFMRVQGAV
ncbi:MAG: hypothetical protein AB2L14_16070 [Candidatus Xenobiia bacterium LiM19]